MMPLKTLGNRFLLKPIEIEEGIVATLPKKFSYAGKVIDAPAGREELKGKVVIYQPNLTRYFSIDDNDFLICKEEAILGYFEEPEKKLKFLPPIDR